MQSVKLSQILEIEDISPLAEPTRSRLHCLAPIGIGSPLAEGLISYICRLADSHCVTPVKLAHWALAQCSLSFQNESLTTHHLISKLEFAYVWNGACPTAAALVDIFTRLTLRREIHLTTLLRYKSCFAPASLSREYRSWCSYCLSEWQEQGRPIYEPLVWNLKGFCVCTRHMVRLSNLCLSCNRQLPILTSHLKPGFCSRCFAWLGHSLPEFKQMHQGYDSWVSRALEQIIERVEPIERELSISEMIQRGADELFDGRLAHFARHLKKSKSTVWTWVNEKSNMQLSDLLAISYAFQVPVLDLLQGKAECWCNAKLIEVPSPSYRHHGCKSIDWNSVGHYLHQIIQGHIYPVPSVDATARRFGISRRRLCQVYPKECKHISDKYQIIRSETSKERWEQLEVLMRSAMLDLLSKGIKPTARLVMSEMNQQDINRKNKRWRKIFAALMTELGCNCND